MKYQDTYKDFESLFKEAVEMGIIAIDIPEDPPTGKKPGYKYNEEAIYSLTMDFHFLSFRDGLIENGIWDGENKKEYAEQLTIENLVQSLRREELKYIEQLSVEGYIKNLKSEIKKKKKTEQEPAQAVDTTQTNKIKWLGTPSQFGFISDLLIKGAYMKKPTSSFEKDAKFYSKIFDITTTQSTLAHELSETTNSMDTKNRKKFTIPPRDELIS